MQKLFDLDFEKTELISEDINAVVSLNLKVGYKIKNRLFADLRKLFSDDYRHMKLELSDKAIVYSGAEHRYYPNITILSNLENRIGELIMGCTMGHHQGVNQLRFQELYEFFGYGVMVIDKDNREVEFVYAKPGDKVLIPSFCNMTIYNLDSKPLVTVDVSNPDLNDSSKSLQGSIGPIFCMHFNPVSRVFSINFNDAYFNRNDGVGVIVEGHPRTSHYIYGLNLETLGSEVYATLEDGGIKEGSRVREFFERLGVRLVRASDRVDISGFQVKDSILSMENKDYINLTKVFLMN